MSGRFRGCWVSCFLIIAGSDIPAARGQCADAWTPDLFRFGGPGANAPVVGLAVADTGAGLRLYAAGAFKSISGTPATVLAEWDGSTWKQNSGPFTGIDVLLPDASGLIIAGFGTDSSNYTGDFLWRYSSGVWTELGRFNFPVMALATGTQAGHSVIYASGSFSKVNGVTFHGVAKYSDGAWSPLGTGPGGTGGGLISGLALFDNGSGATLYAGGFFPGYVAYWTGSAWVTTNAGAAVNSLAVFDDGSGAKLYAATSDGVRRLEGTSWSADANGSASALGVADDGNGPTLFCYGSGLAPGDPQGLYRRHTALSWSLVSNSPAAKDPVWTSYDDGRGQALFFGGSFTTAGGQVVFNIARERNGAWAPVNGGAYGTGIAGVPSAMMVGDAGHGPELFVAGIAGAGGQVVNGIGAWDGARWRALGQGANGAVNDAIAWPASGNGGVVIGGNFTTAGEISAHGVASWDGLIWSNLGAGLEGNIKTLVRFNDGGGDALYAGGQISDSGGTTIYQGVARWDGTQWASLGGVYSGAYLVTVQKLMVFDGENGPHLYAAGNRIQNAYPYTATGFVSVWDGSNWQQLGLDFQFGNTGSVPYQTGPMLTLAAFDGGTGPALCVGTYTCVNGGNAIRSLARWNGTSWENVGGGVGMTPGAPQPGPLALVNSLEVFNDGQMSRLMVGGWFNYAGSQLALNLAGWDGAQWTATSPYAYGTVNCMAAYDDGHGVGLYVGGGFEQVGNYDSYHLARWGCILKPGDLNGDGQVDLSDLAAMLPAFGACEGSAEFQRNMDIVQDGCIDLQDLALLLGQFGQ